MSYVYRPSTPQDEARIIELLAGAFSVTSDAPFLKPELLRWKFWEPCADWPEPRSWVAELDQRVVAHISLWSVTLKSGERGVTMIDWASETAGAGVRLMDRLRKNYQFSYCVGGTPMTQSIIPRLGGFRVVGEALTMARPLRPWKRMVHHQPRSLRLPVRVARNAWWAFSPPRTTGPGWSVVEAGLDDAAALWIERSPRFFEFLNLCPIARCLSFHILKEGRKVGWFALAIGGVQARVAGMWLEDPTPETWRTAFFLAQRTALERTDACEFVARCTTEASCAGARQAGMRERKRVPVYLNRKGPEDLPLPLQFHYCDDDAVFLNIHATRFLT